MRERLSSYDHGIFVSALVIVWYSTLSMLTVSTRDCDGIGDGDFRCHSRHGQGFSGRSWLRPAVVRCCLSTVGSIVDVALGGVYDSLCAAPKANLSLAASVRLAPVIWNVRSGLSVFNAIRSKDCFPHTIPSENRYHSTLRASMPIREEDSRCNEERSS